MEKNRVEVVIDGQIITLVSDEKEEYMQRVALYIDKKLSEIKSNKSNKPVTEHLRTLLISVNIADDYFKAVEKCQVIEDTHEAYVHEMGRMQEESLMLSEKLHLMQAQLSELQDRSSREVERLQEENARLVDVSRDLQEQLQYARTELEEYISTFDEDPEDEEERPNVVNFGASAKGVANG